MYGIDIMHNIDTVNEDIIDNVHEWEDIIDNVHEWEDIKSKEKNTVHTSSDAYDIECFNTNFLNKNVKCDLLLDDGHIYASWSSYDTHVSSSANGMQRTLLLEDRLHTLQNMEQFTKLCSQIKCQMTEH